MKIFDRIKSSLATAVANAVIQGMAKRTQTVALDAAKEAVRLHQAEQTKAVLATMAGFGLPQEVRVGVTHGGETILVKTDLDAAQCVWTAKYKVTA